MRQGIRAIEKRLTSTEEGSDPARAKAESSGIQEVV